MRLTFPHGESADVELSAGDTTIGTAEGSTIRIAGVGVSANHARMHHSSAGLWLRNLGSSIHVNSRAVAELALLRAGDRVHLGDVEMLLRSVAEPMPVPAEPMPTDKVREIEHGTVVLRGLSGPVSGQVFVLNDVLRIGSDVHAQIPLDSRYAAAEEARLELIGDCVMLVSTSPVTPRVNGWPVQQVVVAHGDQIEVRGLRFMLSAPGLAKRASCEVRAQEMAESKQESEHGMVPPKETATGAWLRLLLMALALAAVITALLLFLPSL